MRYGYNGFGQDAPQATSDQVQAGLLYDYIQQDQAYQAVAALQQKDPASREAICQLMQGRASNDPDTTMRAKVDEACRSAGAGEQPGTTPAPTSTASSHTGTYMLLGAVALIGLIVFASSRK